MKKIIFLLWGTALMSLTSFAQQAGRHYPFGITNSSASFSCGFLSGVAEPCIGGCIEVERS